MHAKRVAFIQVGLTYSKLLLQNIALMDRYWKKKDDAIAAQVKGNWVTIEQLVAAHPYAINPGPIRPSTPRMPGMHPDYPPAKVKKKRANDLDLN